METRVVCWENWGLFGSCFQELFSVLENKNTKNLFGEGGVFVFCVFRVLKNHYFENNKKMFSLFFHYSKDRLFFVFSLPLFCIFLATFCVPQRWAPSNHHTPKPFLLPWIIEINILTHGYKVIICLKKL